jgi:hypothetical protein
VWKNQNVQRLQIMQYSSTNVCILAGNGAEEPKLGPISTNRNKNCSTAI